MWNEEKKILQVLKSMEDFFDDLGDMTDEIGSSENTRDSLLVDLQYIFIMAVCITGVPEKVHWLINNDSQSAGSLLPAETSLGQAQFCPNLK